MTKGFKALEAVAGKVGFTYETTSFDFGGDRYLRTGEVLPDSAVDEFRSFDAIYLGAIGHPEVKPGILEKGILLRLRFELDQYINLRPVKLYPNVPTPIKDKGPEDIDFVVVRENTEGLYAGAGGFLKKGTADEVAIQESINTRKGVERCLRYAFEFTRRRNRGKTLTLCGKTNVLTYAWDLWERAFHEVGPEGLPRYPTRLRSCGRYLHVDGEEPRVVQRDRHRQYVRRYHHRSGGDDPGGHGHRRRRQYQSRGRIDVRAHRRFGTQIHRAETSSTRWLPSAPAS